MRPDISVIIPVYNVAPYLAHCLESVLDQTYANIEILLIDDCSTDDSMKIAEKYASQDKRIQILRHSQNRGLSAARNTALKAATAPFIMFLDSDDAYAPEMCEKMMRGLLQSDADCAICATSFIYETDHHMQASDEEYYKLRFSGLETLCDEVLKQTNVSVWNKIYRKSILQAHYLTFPEGLRYEDAYFFNIYACWAKTIFFIPEKLYYYRRRVGSIMNQTFNETAGYSIDHLKIGIKLYKYFKETNFLEQKRNYIIDFLTAYTRLALEKEASSVEKRKIRHLLRDFIEGQNQWFADQSSPFKDKAAHLKTYLRETTLKTFRCKIGKDKITILGITVWRIQIDGKWKRYFLAGIRIAKRRICPSRKIYSFVTDDKPILSVLRDLPPFVYIPNPGNLGDMLIAAASLSFFKKYALPYTLYKNTPAQYIVYGGGGIWTSNYKYLWQRWIPLFQNAKKVVILPSSFYNCSDFVQILDDRFIVFCRENQSYEYLKSFHTQATILLDHDMALRLTDSLFEQQSKKNEVYFKKQMVKCKEQTEDELQKPVSLLLRKDCESRQSSFGGVDISSYIYANENTSEEDIFFMAQTMINLVNQASIVVTDRLHVAIASILLGKETYLLDNSYKKLSNVYKHSLKKRINAFMVSPLPPHIMAKIKKS